MSAEYATFGLAPAMRAGRVLANGGYQVHRDFMDFIVDGRPLLFQLSDLDAVSPLASDVPPAIFTAHVRMLLLQAPAPLADGRCVIYGCPECEGIECGAVTAVIERDGDDIVWRDFAWQTAEQADLELNGYRGMGPFRFRGDEYRAELERLLTDGGDAAPERRRVLLIGARVAVLARLAAALRTIGIGAEITSDAAEVPAEELRTYGAVAFGRAVGEQERDDVRAAFEGAGADVVYVRGLAPVIPLLVAQIEHALDRSPLERRRLTRLTAQNGAAGVEVTSACRVQLVAYRVDRLHRTHTRELFDGMLEPGEHRIPVDGRAVKGQSFLVARTMGSVLVAPMVH
ncbi:oxidoreductase [Streptomyces lunaelactis]|uniref:oxidoreductase n=1 Tax=Streptomyces lunaelactis TaxID=1535768 RepID=UPI001584BC37|nr:oxidoreductase [Streptomyces lunaelactis]NUK36281.1 oxidoreductase [Streptomyces lunaelactis]NUK42789.1 oxidoreductase [Streptomyces lunaelactis]NUK59050.1 oxidoreductase [Streptomyces lunaelactis]NUK93315.1 oxidoreductase [Streptomyces lunaelactis]NUL31736.1 oxidoreductase [Streptomyces lunaelactis]